MGSRFPIWVMGLAALTAGCGGGGGGNLASGGGGSSGGGGTAGCSLLERQNWAASVLNEWYLFPETLPSPTLNPSGYTTLSDYVDAMTSTARGQRRDRYFTYVTSIAQENAFYNSGSSAGFGIRLFYDTVARRVFVTEAFEGAPALATGIDRGTELLAVGTSATTLQTVSDLMASGGSAAVSDALGPTTAGLSRVLQISDAGGTRTITVTKADYTLTPVSSRYGSKIINDGGRQVGYINLRTFISTANAPLTSAVANFRAQGITNIIVDLRYNGGGLVSVAENIGDLLGGNRLTSDVFSRETFRPEKSANNTVRRFAPNGSSASPVKLAFIGTGATASASELVINGMAPFYGTNAALIGANTFGKPVGQIAIDRAACDDRLRVIAFATQNGAGQANYFDGLASTMAVTCRAADDYTKPLGDPQEASVRTALDWLAGTATCTAIAGVQQSQSQSQTGRLAPLAVATPTTAQRETPGLF